MTIRGWALGALLVIRSCRRRPLRNRLTRPDRSRTPSRGWRAAPLHRGSNGYGHRPQARGGPPIGALLGGRTHTAGAPQPRRLEHRRRIRQRCRVHRQNLGPGQSQIAMRGVSAGQIVRDQPGRQGAGRRLPRRVGHLAVAVHPGPRPGSTCRASRSCAARRAPCLDRARSPARCATSRTSRRSA